MRVELSRAAQSSAQVAVFSKPVGVWQGEDISNTAHWLIDRRLQVQHERRVPGEWRIDSGGLFGGAQTLRFGAGRQYAQGELVTMDFGPDKLDSQLLLDYGVLDTARPQV